MKALARRTNKFTHQLSIRGHDLTIDEPAEKGGDDAGPTPQDTVVAVREMPGPPASQSNWVTQHLVYTHGFGFVAASANVARNRRTTKSNIFSARGSNGVLGDTPVG